MLYLFQIYHHRLKSLSDFYLQIRQTHWDQFQYFPVFNILARNSIHSNLSHNRLLINLRLVLYLNNDL